MGALVLDKPLKFHDPSLSRSQQKPSDAVILTVFPHNFRPEVDNDVISAMAVHNVGMDVPLKFGGSRANGSRDIQGADFVSNERTLAKPIPISVKKRFSLFTY